MSSARIYQLPKSAMQSGRAKSEGWVLEFPPSEARKPDPVRGWIGSADTQAQVRLTFDTQDEAVAYATRKGIMQRNIDQIKKQQNLSTETTSGLRLDGADRHMETPSPAPTPPTPPKRGVFGR